MFGSEGHFYNQILRKVVVGFGTVFNDIHLVRYDSNSTETERTKVPLSYSSKSKFVTLINQRQTFTTGANVQMTLPRMGFHITGLNYDTNRKLNSIQKTYATKDSKFYDRYERVPYNVDFGLYIMSKNTEDNLQILEQILPYFAPQYILSINFNDTTDQKVDVPIILNSVTIEDDYEGSPEDRRNIITTLDFTAKTYLYGPVNSGGKIMSTITKFYNIDDFGLQEATHDALVNVRVGAGFTYSDVVSGVTGSIVTEIKELGSTGFYD